MADIREPAKAEAERRWPEWRHLRDSWDAVGMQAAFKQGAEWAWRLRGEADAEAVDAVKEAELTGSGWYPKPRSRVRHEVLAAIRALDEGGQ